MRYLLPFLILMFTASCSLNSVAENPETIIISSPDVLYIETFIGPRMREHFFSLDATKIKKVVLNSRGGKIYDAMAIAEVIHGLRIETVVVKNGICYSSCLIIAQAGLVRTAYSSSKYMLHYAYDTDEDGKTTTDHINSWKYFLKLIEYEMSPIFVEMVVIQNYKKDGSDVDITATEAVKHNIVNHLIVDKK